MKSHQTNQFPLFKSHLDLAHDYWTRLLSSGDIVIDATAGNGHDTLILANLVWSAIKQGNLIALDKQLSALKSTQERISNELPEEKHPVLRLLNQCHSSFPSDITEGSVKLIVYNLGYLPGADKTFTTQSDSTLQSLQAALKLVCAGGAISITCYPGHPEGAVEERRLLEYVSDLSPREWSCCHHRWINRQASPSLLFIQKAYSAPSD